MILRSVAEQLPRIAMWCTNFTAQVDRFCSLAIGATSTS